LSIEAGECRIEVECHIGVGIGLEVQQVVVEVEDNRSLVAVEEDNRVGGIAW
jgi:hypothetical protein